MVYDLFNKNDIMQEVRLHHLHYMTDITQTSLTNYIDVRNRSGIEYLMPGGNIIVLV